MDTSAGMTTGVARELPRYKCHKEVWALKIKDIQPEPRPQFTGATCKGSFVLGTACGTCQRCTWEREHGPKLGEYLVPEESGYAPIFVDAAYMQKHQPKIGGYYVVYDDGYKSFSPAAAFEGGYTPKQKEHDFRRELESAINRHSKENGSNTPDFILAEYLALCLDALDAIVPQREKWYGRGSRNGPAGELADPISPS